MGLQQQPAALQRQSDGGRVRQEMSSVPWWAEAGVVTPEPFLLSSARHDCGRTAGRNPGP